MKIKSYVFQDISPQGNGGTIVASIAPSSSLPTGDIMTISSATSASLAQNPLIKGRHMPDFAQPFALSSDDTKVLSMRGLNADQQKSVESIYAKARTAVQSGQGKSYLASLDAQSLQLLQGAASLADPINPSSLTEEGAENLLLAPTEAVDLNGDGMIQTGAAMGFQFPPVNASPELRAAWEKTTAGMDAGDAMHLSLMMGGPKIAVDGSGAKGQDFSGNFDWNSYMKDMISGNEMAKGYNSAQQYQKMNEQLHHFWSALQEQGLA